MAFNPENYIGERIKNSMSLIRNRAADIKDPLLRDLTLEILEDPSLYVLQGVNKETAYLLAEEGLIRDEEEFTRYIETVKSRQAVSFIYSPGSIMNGHHAYPGGLAYHTAVNLEIALGLADIYQHIYGLRVDRDTLTAAVILHDIAKASVFSWDSEGKYADELIIAGTEAHHVLSLSEALKREFPYQVIKAAASCHIRPKTLSEDLLRYLAAAGIICNRDYTDHTEYMIDIETADSGFNCEDFISCFADSEVFLAEWASGQANSRMNERKMSLSQKYSFLSSYSEFAVFRKS